MAQQFERTIFETSRASEYFNVRELQAQTGQPAYNFVTVALKELVDNALDACETAGVAPEIIIKVQEVEGKVGFSVKDNGNGIQPETIRKILNFDTRTSDKTVYRSPTRGAQGNTLKTVLGMPHALGYDGPLTIEACGTRHTIHIWTDPAGELRIDRDEISCADRGGTSVKVAFPGEIDDEDIFGQFFQQRQKLDYDFHHWARSFSLYNPHATIKIEQAKSGESKIQNSYHSSIAFPGKWRKFLPTDLTSPWWYTTADLERLVFSHIGETRRGNGDLTLREFVRQFKGLSGTAKAKKVCDQFSNIKRLTNFEEKREQVANLLQIMQAQVKPPSPNTLGLVGEEHFKKCFTEWFGVEQMVYKKIARKPNNVPWVFEIALAEDDSQKFEQIDRDSVMFFGVNFSPTYEDPFAGTRLQGHEHGVSGIRSFLDQAYATGRPVAAHMIFPF
jgi:DNA topoisomerase VI subunit B